MANRPSWISAGPRGKRIPHPGLRTTRGLWWCHAGGRDVENLETLLEKVETLEETLEIMQDEELMAAFREGAEALEKDETVAWEDVKRELGLP